MKNNNIKFLVLACSILTVLVSLQAQAQVQVPVSNMRKFNISFVNKGDKLSRLVVAPPSTLAGEYVITLPVPPKTDDFVLKIDKMGVITPLTMSTFATMSGLEDLKKENTALKSQVQTLEARLAQLEAAVKSLAAAGGSNKGGNLLVGDFPTLKQSDPNPFSESTELSYYLPENVSQAVLMVNRSSDGRQVMSMPLTSKGFNSVTISAKELASGTYTCSLVADGKIVSSQQLLIVK